MKKRIIFLLSLFAIIGCKKDPFDYRTKYIGDYTFLIHSKTYIMFDPPIDTSYYQDGYIGYGSEKDKIVISLSGKRATEYTIYEDGTIGENACRGEFESSKKIRYSCSWGSQATKIHEEVTGEKK